MGSPKVRRYAVALGVFGAGLALTILAFYPGYLDNDTLWQLNQAGSGHYNDWHPPIMAWLWHGLLQLTGSYSSLFVLNAAMLWLGLVLTCFCRIRSAIGAAVAVLAIGLLPSVFGPISHYWKDASFGASLVLAFGLYYFGDLKRSGLAVLGGTALVFYAFMVRHNGVLAILPFPIWFALLLVRDLRRRASRLSRRPYLMVICVALFISACFVADRIAIEKEIHSENAYPAQVVMIFDLGGISVRSGMNVLPSFYNRDPGHPLTLADLRRVYDPGSVFGLLWSRLPHPGFLSGENEYRELARAWVNAIVNHPISYFQHRWGLFKAQLGYGRPHWVFGFFRYPAVERWYGFEGASYHRPVENGFRVLQLTPWFAPWAYLLLLLLGGIATCVLGSAHLRASVALFMSAVFYFFGYFICGVAGDFKYVWWSVLASIILLVLVRWENLELLKPGAPKTR